MSRRLALPLLCLLAGCGPSYKDRGIADARSESMATPNTCVSVTSVTLDHVQWSGFLQSHPSKEKFLIVRLRIENTGGGKIVQYVRSVSLTDAFGNEYKKTDSGLSSAFWGRRNAELRPGDSVEDVLVFSRPVDEAEYVDLEVTRYALEGEGSFAFRIPRSMWQKEN